MNGFTIHPVAPAALPLAFIATCDSVVSMMIGVNLKAGMARTCRMTSMPSISGMLRSVSTRWIGSAPQICRA